ncbi:putative toxin-antitoxin system toxin component, PIN family [archaeon]|nr:putative toxin-antitoxin system toxin component, PIN family [archaeon]
MKVVLDTNVLISAFLWSGKPAEVMRQVEVGRVKMYLSQDILEEIEVVLEKDKLKTPIAASGQSVRLVMNKIYSMAHVVSPTAKTSRVKEDPDDDKFLDCAVECKADYIVSGDRHLLKLEEYQRIKIITASQFLKLIKG